MNYKTRLGIAGFSFGLGMAVGAIIGSDVTGISVEHAIELGVGLSLIVFSIILVALKS